MNYDVVVAGGGPAGAAAAITLARAGRTVLLADAGTGPAKVGEALPPAARPLLRDLGLDLHAAGDTHLPYYANLAAWGSSAIHRVEFIEDPNGHGWHLDRPRADRRMRRIAEAAGARIAERTAVRRLRRAPDGTWSLALHGPSGTTAVGCRWIVDATGRRSALAAQDGVRHTRHDRLVAFHATWEPEPGTARGDSSALVESVADGWWYTAPLPSGRLLVAYFTDADLDPPTELHALLDRTRHIRSRTVGHRPPGESPRRAAAHSASLDRAYGEGWIAAGDAVTAFDPVSSQGITTALFTGLTAGRATHAHLAGDPTALPEYQSRIASVLRAYRHNHRTVYGLEQRWSDQPFWRRRLMADRRQAPRLRAASTGT